MKRFTETEKWTKDKWFCELKPSDKLFWLYITDACDNVGVWEENLRVANFVIGYEYSLDTLLKVFDGRIHVFDDGRKWWIRGFVDFQHGVVTEESASKPIASYVSLLKKHRLWKDYTKGIQTLKGKGKGTGKGEGTGYTPEFDAWWGAYGKVGSKANAFKRWKEHLAEHPDNLLDITAQYLSHCKSNDRSLKDGEGWLNGKYWETEWKTKDRSTEVDQEVDLSAYGIGDPG